MPSSTLISATYRLQFNKDFTFRDATRLLDYLSALGITHIYASPILRSRRGSTHGYDVTDPTRLNPELGSDADFAELQAQLRHRGMGIVLDIVPNHMSASSENLWWMDVLENGPESSYASYFDIDWHPPSWTLESKILLPVLGRPFGEALESGEFKLLFQDGRLFVQYFESLFPLAPRTYSRILGKGTEQLRATLGEESPAFQEYSGITAGFATFSTPASGNQGETAKRRPLLESLRERLRQLAASNSQIDSWLRERLREFDGQQNDPASFSTMERLLSDQFYVLSYWQNVNEEINYRRFFNISDLVGLRVEDPLVFEATHALILRLVAQGLIDALRIDHIDGLRDPFAYLSRLREQLSGTSRNEASRPTGIFVEKILGQAEQLPEDWPVEGTTGYDFLNALNSAFVDPKDGKCLEHIYSRFISLGVNYSDLLYQTKKLAMSTLFGVELRALGHQLTLLANSDRYARDLSRSDLTQALIETTAHLPIYRTYIRNLEVSPADARIIEQSLHDAQQRKFYLRPEHFAFVADVLLLRNRPHLLPAQREARLNFVMRWQQFTGPIMAKAFEDTFLYIYNPLVSLNEVGGDPRPAEAAPDSFSRFITTRREHWPHSLNATTTHDTKRSEDVRARLNVLSEIPGEWQQHLERWVKLNARHKTKVNGQLIPDRNEEIFLYQTLLGAYPLQPVENDAYGRFLDRLQSYVIKATREAKVHTRWTLPNAAHEEALQKFVAALLRPAKQNAFLADFRHFHQQISLAGMLNGLSQTLLKIVSPGIPDFYQGSELWDLRLVDPDNRAPVDFQKRVAMFDALKNRGTMDSAASDLMQHRQDGRVKLFTIGAALNFRKDHRELFAAGDFQQLPATGERRDHIIAILRHYKQDWALLVAPRWLARAKSADPQQFWQDTAISLPPNAPARWQNIFTQESTKSADGRNTLPISKLLQHFPVALLRPAEVPRQKPARTNKSRRKPSRR
jgi:(1->4)-alpha-D-glucan 1-alpha-D-glucosylmutase